MKSLFKKFITIFPFVFLLGCNSSDGTSTGNPLINLRYAAFYSSLSSQISTMAVSQTNLCFKRLRFKTAGETTNSNPDLDEDNIDFSIGDKSIISTGGALGDIRVPNGTYTRIEIDLANQCGNGYSVLVTNGSGTFSTVDRISIKFQGNIVITGSVSMELILQNLVTELNAVTNSSQIKSRLESANGSF